jgi:hypothetical protein
MFSLTPDYDGTFGSRDASVYAVGMHTRRDAHPSAFSEYPECMQTMSKEQLLSCGTIALGLAFSFAGLFELSTGQFMPGGYRNDSAWLVSSALLKFFRECGPYLSGATWLMLAAVCFRTGSGMLRDAGGLRRPQRRSLKQP